MKYGIPSALNIVLILWQFLWNGSSNIWHPLWGRPLRPSVVKKVSNGGSGVNVHYSGTHAEHLVWTALYFVSISNG